MDGLRTTAAEVTKHAIQWAQSDNAFHVYSWLLIVATLFISLWYAICLIRKVRKFNLGDLIWRPRGAKPRRIEAIVERIEKLKKEASERFNKMTGNTLGLVFVEIIIPGALLGIIAAQENWFMPGVVTLTYEGVPTSSSELSYADLLLFVTDQSLRGSLSDTFEVFDLALTHVQSNPNSWLFSIFVLLFRILSGIVFIAVLFVSFRIVLATSEAKKNIQLWERELEELNMSEKPLTAA